MRAIFRQGAYVAAPASSAFPHPDSVKRLTAGEEELGFSELK